MKQFYLLIIIFCSLSNSTVFSQPVLDSVEETYLQTGGRIFTHRLYLAGIVEYDGEEIPWYKIDPVSDCQQHQESISYRRGDSP